MDQPKLVAKQQVADKEPAVHTAADDEPVLEAHKEPVVQAAADKEPVLEAHKAPVVQAAADKEPVLEAHKEPVVQAAADNEPVLEAHKAPVVQAAADQEPAVEAHKEPVVDADKAPKVVTQEGEASQQTNDHAAPVIVTKQEEAAQGGKGQQQAGDKALELKLSKTGETDTVQGRYISQPLCLNHVVVYLTAPVPEFCCGTSQNPCA